MIDALWSEPDESGFVEMTESDGIWESLENFLITSENRSELSSSDPRWIELYRTGPNWIAKLESETRLTKGESVI